MKKVSSDIWYIHPSKQTEVDLIIPGMIDGKQVEIGRECFRDLAIYNLFLNIKFQEENGTKVKFNQDCAHMFANTTGILSSINSLDFSGADTSNVTNMRDMFSDCNGLKSLDLRSFNTSNVTYMSWMFSDCHNLTSLDVSKFDTKNVTNISGMQLVIATV